MKTNDESQIDFLAACINDFKIFLDASALLQPNAEKFLQNVVPLLDRAGKSMIVPLSVWQELEKHANNPEFCQKKSPDDPYLNSRAVRACKNIIRLKNAKLVEIFADPDDGSFADHVFLYVFSKMRMKYNLLLVTHDKGLASEILKLGKDNRAVHGIKKILVRKIDGNGFPEKIFTAKDSKPVKNTETSQEIPINERFAFADTVVNISGNLPVTNIPKSGDTVTVARNNQRKSIKLLDEIGSGGEGSVFATDLDGIVAKIYRPEKITRLRHEKLKLMLTKDIDCEGICFPLAIVENLRGEFVGYIMRTAKGRDLGKSVFMPMLLKKYFPTWTRKDTVRLCVTILQKLKYLHDRNIILGDINPYNILVVSPTEIYFVDTDSWQVEGFVCPVGMPLFTPPELQKKSDFGLRTLGNENFAVATLLFMIMHPGKPPYAMQDGEGIAENIISGDFSYPFGELRTGKVPKGPWRYCWSHLTYQIKETFYHTFRHDGIYHDEKKRPGTGRWLRLFTNYLNSLESGKMTAHDEEALLIFPTRFKHDRNKTYAKCKICGKEFEEDHLEQGFCRNCLNDGEKYHCARCGREMIYTNYQRLIKRAKRREICRDCSEQRNKVFERRVCRNCGRMFEITYGQKEFFDKKGLSLPLRCENCRGNQNRPLPHRTINFQPSPQPSPAPKTQDSGIFSWIFDKIFN